MEAVVAPRAPALVAAVERAGPTPALGYVFRKSSSIPQQGFDHLPRFPPTRTSGIPTSRQKAVMRAMKSFSSFAFDAPGSRRSLQPLAAGVL